MTTSRAVLYDVEWQCLRVSCLREHHALGGWTTLEGTKDNLRRFSDYLVDSPPGDEYYVRAYRIVNCLNAIRMGYSGQGLKGSEQDEAVRAIRDTVQEVMEPKIVENVGKRWDWFEVEDDLRELYVNDYTAFKQLLENLATRAKVARKRGRDTANTRPDLLKMLTLMGHVRNTTNVKGSH